MLCEKGQDAAPLGTLLSSSSKQGQGSRWVWMKGHSGPEALAQCLSLERAPLTHTLTQLPYLPCLGAVTSRNLGEMRLPFSGCQGVMTEVND